PRPGVRALPRHGSHHSGNAAPLRLRPMQWNWYRLAPDMARGRGLDPDHRVHRQHRRATLALAAVTSKGGAPGQVLGGGVRKAYKSKGDDVTLSRFVKVPGSIRTHEKPR